MFYLVLGLCAVVVTFAIVRFFAAKTRLAESAISDAIARQLTTGKHGIALSRLKEDNVVMRNLLIDMIENEASAASIDASMPAAQKKRILNDRILRRREIFGEALAIVERRPESADRSTASSDTIR